MKLIFHGRLRELYGDSFVMASDVPAVAIEGFFSQQPEHPRDLLIDAVGYDTEEKLRKPTESAEVHLIPTMYGGGGNFGKIVLGAALIGLALVLPGLGTGLSAVLMSTVTSAALGMGISFALQGVMGLFFKSPTSSKEEDPEPSRYLGINQNTTAQGTPITIACGRMQVGGHWLSLQSDADKLARGKFPETFS